MIKDKILYHILFLHVYKVSFKRLKKNFDISHIIVKSLKDLVIVWIVWCINLRAWQFGFIHVFCVVHSLLTYSILVILYIQYDNLFKSPVTLALQCDLIDISPSEYAFPDIDECLGVVMSSIWL